MGSIFITRCFEQEIRNGIEGVSIPTLPTRPDVVIGRKRTIRYVIVNKELILFWTSFYIETHERVFNCWVKYLAIDLVFGPVEKWKTFRMGRHLCRYAG